MQARERRSTYSWQFVTVPTVIDVILVALVAATVRQALQLAKGSSTNSTAHTKKRHAGRVADAIALNKIPYIH